MIPDKKAMIPCGVAGSVSAGIAIQPYERVVSHLSFEI